MLLVLVLLVAMVGAAGLAKYLVGGYRLSAAAQAMAEDIRLVQQMNANQDGTGYAIVFDCSKERYLLIRRVGARLVRAVDLPPGIDLCYTNFELDTLSFYTNGKPRPYGGHAALRDRSGRYLYVIVQTMTGRVRVDTSLPS